MSDRTITAIVTGVAGLALVVALRWLLHHALARWLRVVEARRGVAEAASMRTRLAVLQRLVVAFLVLIVAWQVLSIYPETGRLGNAVLASGAVIALVVGLALTTPLSNLGGGVLLAFTQPVRIGDRIAIADVTGTVEEITLIHTILVTDDDRRVFVPNSQMVTSVVTNRSVVDPRRTVTVELPLRIDGSVGRARDVVLEAGRAGVPPGTELAVRVARLTETTAWLTLTALAAPAADVAELAGDLRERALAALAREQLLPA